MRIPRQSQLSTATKRSQVLRANWKMLSFGVYNHENKRQWYVDEHFHQIDNGGAYTTFFAERWKFVTRVINKKTHRQRE